MGRWERAEEVIATHYLERPARALPEVACTWTQALPAGSMPYVQRVVPDGCIDVVWWMSSGRLEVAGPDTTAFFARLTPGDRLLGVRFRPGRAPAALGIPADAIRDEHLPLRELWGPEADALNERRTSSRDALTASWLASGWGAIGGELVGLTGHVMAGLSLGRVGVGAWGASGGPVRRTA